MKLPLHLKVALLLAYVSVCTQVLVAAHLTDRSFGIDVTDTAALRQQAESAFTRPDGSGGTKS